MQTMQPLRRITRFSGSAFTRQLARREILDRGLPLRWWSEFQSDLHVYTVAAAGFIVPAGFLTDGASVPRAVWALLASQTSSQASRVLRRGKRSL
jgi:hypothetical protein